MDRSLLITFIICLQITGYCSSRYNCEELCFGLYLCVQECKNPNIFTGIAKQTRIRASESAYQEEKKATNENLVANSGLTQENVEDVILQVAQDTPPRIDNCGHKRTDTNDTNHKNIKMYVVGGTDADPFEFPWQISIQMFSRKTNKLEHFCGGAILNHYWVVTAAHCVDKLKGREDKLIIKVGSNSVDDNKTATYQVDKLIVHNLWDRETQANDISLLKIKTRIDYKVNDVNQYEVNCIGLPDKNSEPVGTATLTGFGQLNETGPPADYLQKLDVPIYDSKQCAINYKQYVNINDLKLCAGGKGGQDSCMGDSGGPLIQNKNRWVLIGVVSFGYPCAVKGMPGVYTKISKYIDWIEKNIN